MGCITLGRAQPTEPSCIQNVVSHSPFAVQLRPAYHDGCQQCVKSYKLCVHIWKWFVVSLTPSEQQLAILQIESCLPLYCISKTDILSGTCLLWQEVGAPYAVPYGIVYTVGRPRYDCDSTARRSSVASPTLMTSIVSHNGCICT